VIKPDSSEKLYKREKGSSDFPIDSALSAKFFQSKRMAAMCIKQCDGKLILEVNNGRNKYKSTCKV
jgi:hypothetical protein